VLPVVERPDVPQSWEQAVITPSWNIAAVERLQASGALVTVDQPRHGERDLENGCTS